jgi:hypothetical protein
MFLLGGLGTALSGGAAAGGAAAAGTGFSISSVLQGLATVGGVVATIAAGNAEAQRLEMQANDAEAEKPFETLQSVDRKRGLLKAAAEAVGQQDVAYAASGVDLSFGSARQARTDAFRELDVGLETDSGTTMSRLARLTERAANYRSMAKNARRMGLISGLTSGLQGFTSLGQQY